MYVHIFLVMCGFSCGRHRAVLGRPRPKMTNGVKSLVGGPMSLCETGSKTAVVMVLLPKRACDKYLTTSDIWDLLGSQCVTVATTTTDQPLEQHRWMMLTNDVLLSHAVAAIIYQ